MGYADTYGKIQKPEDSFDVASKNPNLSSLALAKVLQGSNLFKTQQSNMPQFSGNDRITQSANVGLGVVQSRNNMKADIGRSNIIADLVKTDMSGKSQLAQEQARNTSAMAIAKFDGGYKAQQIANEQKHYADQAKQGLMDNNTKLYELGLNVGQKERDSRALVESNILANQQKNQEAYAQNLVKLGEQQKEVDYWDMNDYQKAVYEKLNGYIAPQSKAPKFDSMQRDYIFKNAVSEFKLDPTKAHLGDDGILNLGDGRQIDAQAYYSDKINGTK